MFLCFLNSLQASHEENGFVMIAENETTPLLQDDKKNTVYILKDNSAQLNNRLHRTILSHLDEHGVDDTTDRIIECLDCCCPVFKNCFGNKK